MGVAEHGGSLQLSVFSSEFSVQSFQFSVLAGKSFGSQYC